MVAKHSPSENTGQAVEGGEAGENVSRDHEAGPFNGIHFTFTTTDADGGSSDKTVNLADIDEEARIVVDNIVRDTRAHVEAQLHFVAQEEESDGQMQAAFLKTPMASFQAAVVPASEKGAKTSAHVAVFFDVKLSDEPNSRPALRVAPLRQERYEGLVKMVMNRFKPGDTDLAELPTGDL